MTARSDAIVKCLLHLSCPTSNGSQMRNFHSLLSGIQGVRCLRTKPYSLCPFTKNATRVSPSCSLSFTCVQSIFSGRTVSLVGKGLSWSVADRQVLDVDMASSKTLHAIHRRRRWPYSSDKQMAARLKEGEMDVTFLARSVAHERLQSKTGRKLTDG